MTWKFIVLTKLVTNTIQSFVAGKLFVNVYTSGVYIVQHIVSQTPTTITTIQKLFATKERIKRIAASFCCEQHFHSRRSKQVEHSQSHRIYSLRFNFIIQTHRLEFVWISFIIFFFFVLECWNFYLHCNNLLISIAAFFLHFLNFILQFFFSCVITVQRVNESKDVKYSGFAWWFTKIVQVSSFNW